MFNTEGSTALEKSIINDEGSVRDLLYQFQSFLNKVVKQFNRKGHYWFRVEMLETTIYNYKELSKMYKEQTQVGFGKLLPQIALGHSQSAILATMQFENNVLKLSEIMIPPMMSSTMSSKTVAQQSANNQIVSQDTKKAGRPELEEDQKSEKTLKNKEAEK
nr:MAG TPA: portal protein [Caudoviricetes sp.]